MLLKCPFTSNSSQIRGNLHHSTCTCGLLHKTGETHPKIWIQPQNPWAVKAILGLKNKFQNILQSCGHQSSRVQALKQTRKQAEQNRGHRNSHSRSWSPATHTKTHIEENSSFGEWYWANWILRKVTDTWFLWRTRTQMSARKFQNDLKKMCAQHLQTLGSWENLKRQEVKQRKTWRTAWNWKAHRLKDRD